MKPPPFITTLFQAYGWAGKLADCADANAGNNAMQRPVAKIFDGNSGLMFINDLMIAGFMAEIVGRATAMSSMRGWGDVLNPNSEAGIWRW
jgi:hypothetical protein